MKLSRHPPPVSLAGLRRPGASISGRARTAGEGICGRRFWRPASPPRDAAPVAGPATAQGYGSAAVANVGPPEDALFPGLAALQDRLEEQGWMLRGQATFVLQGHPGFRSPYRGEGSLAPKANARNTLSTDLILGRQLWPGAEVVVDASVTRGFGLSNSTGVASYPNNEAFRLGSTEPSFFVPRAFFRQTIALSADSIEDADPLRFGTTRPRERLTITLGNSRSGISSTTTSTPMTPAPNSLGAGRRRRLRLRRRRPRLDRGRRRRMGGWALGHPARRLPGGAAGQWAVPRPCGDPRLPGNHPTRQVLEPGWPAGALRGLYGLSRTRQSRWEELPPDGTAPFAINPQGYRNKHMLAANLEQEVADGVGVFARLSWNDGRTHGCSPKWTAPSPPGSPSTASAGTAPAIR
ncbi:hypothetical protein ACFQU2_00835 [Siccirubricoccus deserti]